MELIVTLSGVLFGAVGMLIAVQQHIKALRKEWKSKLEEEKERHSQANVKAYAAQRDFQHLERHLGQHKEAIKMLEDELEEVKGNQIEMKTLLRTIAHNTGDKS